MVMIQKRNLTFDADFVYNIPKKHRLNPLRNDAHFVSGVADAFKNGLQESFSSDRGFTVATRSPITNYVDNIVWVLPLKMIAASICIPKDNPKNPRGDDAHFISPETQSVGVADGVGGWRKYGIDGGEYARRIMHNSLIALQENPHYALNPKMVLEEAYRNTAAQGSSTACIISLSGDNVLRAVNVGDSGFMVVRDGAVFYRSPTQQKSFNCPYQLGSTKDGPSVAEEIEVRVEKGDVLVVGTDGLLDNVHEWEITEIVGRGKAGGEDLADQCVYMANLALYNSFNKYSDTPYSIASKRAGKCHRGGKVDDISVIMATIT